MKTTSDILSPSSLHSVLNDGKRGMQLVSFIVFAVSLCIYFLTADRSASFWDCPEYVTCASRLEVGHPPGNPVWMLAMRAITFPLPPGAHPFAINLASGLMTALGALFLSRICWVASALLFSSGKRIIPAFAALAGGFSFSFCDSVWFSAVEAEVYAMSAFFSLLSLWLTLKWYVNADTPAGNRLLILIAYLMGLSLGVHQLNLLIIPVIALAVCYRLNPGRVTFIKGIGALVAGCGSVVLILFGMMNGMLRLAERCELIAVNSLSLPYFSGVVFYALLLILLFVIIVPRLDRINEAFAPSLLWPVLFLSGIFYFGDFGYVSVVIAAIVAIFIFRIPGVSRKAIITGAWSIGFIMLGFSSFALILIRGYAAPPMNEGAPTDIFALHSYIAREQYGSAPLVYGRTPYSRALLREDASPSGGVPRYSRIVLERKRPKYIGAIPGAHLGYRSGFMSAEDSAANNAILSQSKEGYIIADYTYKAVTTPELNMWFPRITSSDPSHIESYADWAGMTKDNMSQIPVSATLDPEGKPAGRMNAGGKREKETSYRPTYLQNLRYFLAYQVGYMYLRYLGWNFIGRQNDIPSTGEIEHGNVITGIPFIDTAMVGDYRLMPDYAGSANKGHNAYYAIPFLLGVVGFIALCRAGKRGKRWATLSLLLFLMTGIAIVVYLNQTPGEPRERDYSFLVSYAVFSFWIACGVARLSIVIAKKFPAGTFPIAAILATISPLLLLAENFDDHNRRGRGEPLHLAADLLEGTSPSIIFTQGDNYTFPLWFAQETMGIGKKHCVIDLSYLSLPEYVVNLKKQGNLPLTAKPEDIAFGAYAFTRIAENADTIPVPLIEALRNLYASKEGSPVFTHSRVWIPGATPSDTIVLNLHDFAGGGNSIPFRRLMILDILASSLETPDAPPVRFLNRVRTDLFRPLLPAMKRDDYTIVYSPGLHDSALDQPVRPTPSLPDYAEPVVVEMVRQRRGELTAVAERISINDPLRAVALLEDIRTAYPDALYPPGTSAIGDSLYYEGERRALLLSELAYRLDRPDLREQASSVVEGLISESEGWNRFLTSLPKERRGTLSTTTRRKAARLPKLRSLLTSIETNHQTNDTISPETADSIIFDSL